jgi:putative N-acetyltransferase (TIGR04045 family)
MATRIAQEIRPARTERERDDALALRRRVFCEEQGVSEADEVDGRDAGARHLVALRDGRVVGTCRLILDGDTAKLGRMAVERSSRRHGLGAGLTAAAVREARAAGAVRVALHAQTTVRRLYEREGFRARGDVFEEAGIDHVRMELALGA